MNDQLKGQSPVTYDFAWYGWYRLTLRKEGFERQDDRRLLRAPVYLWIPLDLVTELLPLTIRDTRTWSYTLTPATTPPSPVPPAITPPETVSPASDAATPPAASSDEPPQETTDAAR